MARDDYYVVVYQILAYLYTQLKEGKPVDGKMLEHDSTLFGINEQYWEYVIENLITQGLIIGPKVIKTWGNETVITGLDAAQITPTGIDYLCENSFLSKAKHFLKDVKAIVPFV